MFRVETTYACHDVSSELFFELKPQISLCNILIPQLSELHLLNTHKKRDQGMDLSDNDILGIVDRLWQTLPQILKNVSHNQSGSQSASINRAQLNLRRRRQSRHHLLQLKLLRSCSCSVGSVTCKGRGMLLHTSGIVDRQLRLRQAISHNQAERKTRARE